MGQTCQEVQLGHSQGHTVLFFPLLEVSDLQGSSRQE